MIDDSHLSRAADQIKRAAERPVFTNFLDETGLAEYKSALRRAKNVEYIELGGYEGAVRAVLAIYPAGEQPASCAEAVRCIRIEDKAGAGLTHRDYLGALMALGVKRELVGDIVTDDCGAYVFCTAVMERLILDELSKVGSHGVEVHPGDPSDVRPNEPDLITKNVSSMRLDCVVASAINKNRELVKNLIENGSVNLNGLECKKPAREVEEGDVFSIRGFGRYRVGKQTGISSKNRIFLELYKY